MNNDFHHDPYTFHGWVRNTVFGLSIVGLAFGLFLLLLGYADEKMIGLILIISSIAFSILALIWMQVEDIALESRRLRIMKADELSRK